MNLFPPAEPQEEGTRGRLSRDVAPMWVFGRISKKKGRHIQVLKGHPDAAIVCIAYRLSK